MGLLGDAPVASMLSAQLQGVRRQQSGAGPVFFGALTPQPPSNLQRPCRLRKDPLDPLDNNVKVALALRRMLNPKAVEVGAGYGLWRGVGLVGAAQGSG